MNRSSRLFAPVAMAVVAAVTLAACGGDEDPVSSAAGPHVVVTTNILGDIVQQVVGDAGSVDVLLGPGQDPHGFSPSARQAADLRDADLVIANGLQLEEGLVAALEAAESDGVEVLYVADGLDPLEAGLDAHADEDDHAHESEADHADEDDHADESEADHADEDDHADENEADHADEDDHAHESEADHADEDGDHADEDGHDHGSLDPHVWFDPVRMADAAAIIAAHIAEVDATTDTDWEARGEAVAESILDAHDEVASILGEIPEACRRMVTNHDALTYLAARYDLEIVGTVIPGTSSQASASAGEFAALVDLVRDTGVPAIFAENTLNQDLVRTLADEVGRDIEIVELYTDSLDDAESGADTYVGLLTTDARLIADALADC